MGREVRKEVGNTAHPPRDQEAKNRSARPGLHLAPDVGLLPHIMVADVHTTLKGSLQPWGRNTQAGATPQATAEPPRPSPMCAYCAARTHVGQSRARSAHKPRSSPAVLLRRADPARHAALIHGPRTACNPVRAQIHLQGTCAVHFVY